MASGLLLLLDDITTILDDVALLTKVAAKKTAGVLGDDLALNAQQVSGVDASRELPVVWAVAKGSFVNKAILVPSALLLSAVAPWSIEPLMIAGGTYLCFEGCEKLAHKFLHPGTESEHRKRHEKIIADETVDVVALEKSKISGAIRTDFILSAEIIVITLGTVATSGLMMRTAVLIAVGLLMTIGVYGLVAGIVKLDDLGARMIETQPTRALAGARRMIGRGILSGAPYLMKFLSIAGTIAMFLVGGGILVHGVPPLHHLVDGLTMRIAGTSRIGVALSSITEMVFHAVVGITVGAVVLAGVSLVKSMYHANSRRPAQ